MHCIINYSLIPYGFGSHRLLLIWVGGKHAKQLYPEEERESTSGRWMINSTISWHDYRPCCTFLSGVLICYLGLSGKHTQRTEAKEARAAASKWFHQPAVGHRVTHLVAFFQQELSQVRSILGRERYRKVLETQWMGLGDLDWLLSQKKGRKILQWVDWIENIYFAFPRFMHWPRMLEMLFG